MSSYIDVYINDVFVFGMCNVADLEFMAFFIMEIHFARGALSCYLRDGAQFSGGRKEGVFPTVREWPGVDLFAWPDVGDGQTRRPKVNPWSRLRMNSLTSSRRLFRPSSEWISGFVSAMMRRQIGFELTSSTTPPLPTPLLSRLLRFSGRT